MRRPEVNMARWIWRRLYRELRLLARAQDAELNHHIMWGDPEKIAPRGILNVHMRDATS